MHGARGASPQAVTLVVVKDRSRESVMEALRVGRTLAWFNNLVCAHKWALESLMGSLVEVHLQDMPDDKVRLCLQNRGPAALEAQLTGMPIAPFTLGTHQKVLVGLRRKPDVVTVLWKNLYLRSTEDLTTTHSLVPTGQREQGPK